MIKTMISFFAICAFSFCFAEEHEVRIVDAWQKLEEKELVVDRNWDTDHIGVAREVVEIVRPSRIVEIGLNTGHSAALWLILSEAHLLSIDMGESSYYEHTVRVLLEQFGDRFVPIKSDSRQAFPYLAPYANTVDLVFIDGGHSSAIVLNELKIAYDLRAPYVLVDDTSYEPVKEAMVDFLYKANAQLVKKWEAGFGVELYEIDYTKPNLNMPEAKSRKKITVRRPLRLR